MAITSRELGQKARNTPKARELHREFGQIDTVYVRDAFIRVVHVAAWLLIALSVIGTFYAILGKPAPLPDVVRIARDIARAPEWFAVALVAQAVLAVTQWGARLFAAENRNWWLMYAASLAISVVLNWSAYAPTLMALRVPILPIAVIIIAGDVFPELVLVKRQGGDDEEV